MTYIHPIFIRLIIINFCQCFIVTVILLKTYYPSIIISTAINLHIINQFSFFPDFTSVNSFQDEIKFTSPSFYNLSGAPPSRPSSYDVQNYQTPNNTPNGPVPPENYYAATDIIKVHDPNCRTHLLRVFPRPFPH